jgi:hypothetical protein
MTKALTYLICFVILSVSCKKEYSKEASLLSENFWEFSELQEHFAGPVDSAFIVSSINGEALIIYGISADDHAYKFNLRISADNMQPGTFEGEGVQFLYSGIASLSTAGNERTGISVVIEKMDDKSVAGTFSGIIYDSINQLHSISNGKFKCSIKRITSIPTKNTLTVWTKEMCGVNNQVEIRIGTASQFITSVHTEQPLCGAAGTASFSLDNGNYPVSVICGSDTLTYGVIIQDECSFLEVQLNQDYLPLGKTSYWEYSDMHDQNVSQTFTAASDVVFNNNTYTKFSSTRGIDYYFRKLPHIYYQYRELSFQDFVSNPPLVELVILKDDLPKGGKWETEPLDVSISGVVQKIKMVSRIIDRDYSDVINGVSYQNLIKVNTELFFSPDNGNSYATSGSAYSTVFAKGKGIVSYNDMDVAIEWGIKNIFLSP